MSPHNMLLSISTKKSFGKILTGEAKPADRNATLVSEMINPALWISSIVVMNASFGQ